MITRSSSIWTVTIARAASVFAVMSPNPTVDRIVTVTYSPPCGSSPRRTRRGSSGTCPGRSRRTPQRTAGRRVPPRVPPAPSGGDCEGPPVPHSRTRPRTTGSPGPRAAAGTHGARGAAGRSTAARPTPSSPTQRCRPDHVTAADIPTAGLVATGRILGRGCIGPRGRPDVFRVPPLVVASGRPRPDISSVSAFSGIVWWGAATDIT